MRINDGPPYHCVTHTTVAPVQSLVVQSTRQIQSFSMPGDFSPPEYTLRQIIDPTEHDRLYDEFRSADPDLMIVLGDDETAEILRDFVSYLGGGIPFESSALSSDTPSITGGPSGRNSRPKVTIR